MTLDFMISQFDAARSLEHLLHDEPFTSFKHPFVAEAQSLEPRKLARFLCYSTTLLMTMNAATNSHYTAEDVPDFLSTILNLHGVPAIDPKTKELLPQGWLTMTEDTFNVYHQAGVYFARQNNAYSELVEDVPSVENLRPALSNGAAAISLNNKFLNHWVPSVTGEPLELNPSAHVVTLLTLDKDEAVLSDPFHHNLSITRENAYLKIPITEVDTFFNGRATVINQKPIELSSYLTPVPTP